MSNQATTYAREEVLTEAAGMNELGYELHRSPRLLEVIAQINRSCDRASNKLVYPSTLDRS